MLLAQDNEMFFSDIGGLKIYDECPTECFKRYALMHSLSDGFIGRAIDAATMIGKVFSFYNLKDTLKNYFKAFKIMKNLVRSNCEASEK